MVLQEADIKKARIIAENYILEEEEDKNGKN